MVLNESSVDPPPRSFDVRKPPIAASSGGLYSYLRGHALDLEERRVLDVGRFWSVDYPCVEAGTLYAMVVYLRFSGTEMMDYTWERVRTRLTVDAAVYLSRPSGLFRAPLKQEDCSMALIFSPFCPLAGPMTYGEVEWGAMHYLGGCPSLQDARSLWESMRRCTIELVPRSGLTQ